MGTSNLTRTLVVAIALLGGAALAALQGGAIPVGLEGDEILEPTEQGSYIVTVSDIEARGPRKVAPPYNVNVTVTGNSAVWGAVFPKTVTVPANYTSKLFTMTPLSSAPSGNTTLTASCGGQSQHLVVTID